MLCIAISAAAAAEPITPISIASSATWSGNNHQYAVVLAEGVSWDEAAALAGRLPGDWHLATVTSPAEQLFIQSLGLANIEYWLGGFQNPLSTQAADANWTWVTAEPFAYANWDIHNSEPNDFIGPGGEQYLAVLGAAATLEPYGTWNDEGFLGNISGFIAESASLSPTPEPTTVSLMLLAACAAGLARQRQRQP